MPIVSCDIPVDLVNRLNTVCLALGFSRNHVLKVLIKEEVEKLEKQMLTPIGEEVSAG